MHRRLPPLNALKSFEAAARHLSFTKAADELFVTQAAVSHQIKALGDFLSMKLFLRRNRTLLLTEEGQAYFLELKDIFKNLQDATERLLAKGSKGAITVAMPPSFASQWLVPRIHKFSLAHPDIDVRIKAVDFDEGFLEDDVDVAIYYGKGRWAGLQADQLHREFLTPLCSPMLFQGPKLYKTLTAQLTNVFPFSTMNPFVFSEPLFPFETRRTLRALKRLFVREQNQNQPDINFCLTTLTLLIITHVIFGINRRYFTWTYSES